MRSHIDNGMVFCLYERNNLAWDGNVKPQPRSANEFAMGYFVNSDEEVDAVMKKAETADSTITRPAQEAFGGGYHGYFQDIIDGHLWEIGHNPSWKIKE